MGGIGTQSVIDSIIAGSEFVADNAWNFVGQSNYKRNFQYQKHYDRNKYQIAVDDMRRSGLNPILAVSKGVGGGSVTTPSQPNFRQTRLSERYAALRQAHSAAKVAETTADLNKSQVELNAQKESTEAEMQHKIHADAEKARKEQALVDAKVVREIAESKAASAREAQSIQDALLKEYENYKRKVRSQMYKGKKGKVVNFIDWLTEKFRISGSAGVHKIIK